MPGDKPGGSTAKKLVVSGEEFAGFGSEVPDGRLARVWCDGLFHVLNLPAGHLEQLKDGQVQEDLCLKLCLDPAAALRTRFIDQMDGPNWAVIAAMGIDDTFRPIVRRVYLDGLAVRLAGPDACVFDGRGCTTCEAWTRLRDVELNGCGAEEPHRAIVATLVDGRIGVATTEVAVRAGEIGLDLDPVEVEAAFSEGPKEWLLATYSKEALDELAEIARNGWAGLDAWKAKEGPPDIDRLKRAARSVR